MTFTVATKPLSESLNLGVVPANISRFYQKSCMVQLIANRTTLKINIETDKICTELELRGSGDSDVETVMFVDSGLLRSLVNTFESTTTDIVFEDNGVVLQSGRSKFNLEKMAEVGSMRLQAPTTIPVGVSPIQINIDHWKFVKEHQLYAVAMSFIHPIYRNVWMGEDGESLVGDYDNSLFTRSHNGDLGRTCLLTDTIVHLINTMPTGATMYPNGESFLIDYQCDSFKYLSEFTPKYESDPAVGPYNAPIIQAQLAIDETNIVTTDKKALNKFIAQADLLSTASDETIHVAVNPGTLSLHNPKLNCTVEVSGQVAVPYDLEFRTSVIKSVISHLDEDEIRVSPVSSDDEIVGIVFSTKNMSVVIGSVD